jgi:hypothetical protein
MLYDTLDEAFRENRFVKKMFAARKAAINAGAEAQPAIQANENQTNQKHIQKSLL